MADQDNQNPFAPPQSDIGTGGYEAVEGAPAYKLYSPGQVTWATFLGSPLAGCAVLAANYSKMGNINSAVTTLIGGVLASIAVFAVAVFTPENFPGSVISAGYTIILYYLAKNLQGRAFQRHIAAGGRQASSWGATGIALACLFLFLLVGVGIVLVVDFAVET